MGDGAACETNAAMQWITTLSSFSQFSCKELTVAQDCNISVTSQVLGL